MTVITQGQTGPKSLAGKAISSLNAIKHGGYSKKRLLPFEDAKAYQAHLKEVLEDLQPSNSVQKVAASQYADALWRVERIQVRHEQLIDQEDCKTQKSLPNEDDMQPGGIKKSHSSSDQTKASVKRIDQLKDFLAPANY